MARSPVPCFLGRSAVSPRASASPRALPVASAAGRPRAGPGGPPGAAHPRGGAATQSSAQASSGGRLKPACRLRPARCQLRPRGPPEARPLQKCGERPKTRKPGCSGARLRGLPRPRGGGHPSRPPDFFRQWSPETTWLGVFPVGKPLLCHSFIHSFIQLSS